MVKGCAIFGLAIRVRSLAAFDHFEKSTSGGKRARVLPVRVCWRQPVFDRMEESVVVFHLHSEHAQVDGAPRRGLYDNLAECCAGSIRIVASNMNMAFRGLIPELAARGVELHRIANHGEWNINSDKWQWYYMGI